MYSSEWKKELKKIKDDFKIIEGTIDSIEIYESSVRHKDWMGLELIKENINLAKNTFTVMLHSIRLAESMNKIREEESK